MRAAVEKPSDVADLHRPVPQPPLRAVDFDQWLEPKEAARSGAHDLDVSTAVARLGGKRSGDLVGADRDRRGIGRDVEAGHSPRAPRRRDDRVDFGLVEPRHGLAVDQRRGGKRAVPEAIDRLYGSTPSSVAVDDEPMLLGQALDEPLDPRRLARLGAANFHHRRCRPGPNENRGRN